MTIFRIARVLERLLSELADVGKTFISVEFHRARQERSATRRRTSDMVEAFQRPPIFFSSEAGSCAYDGVVRPIGRSAPAPRSSPRKRYPPDLGGTETPEARAEGGVGSRV